LVLLVHRSGLDHPYYLIFFALPVTSLLDEEDRVLRCESLHVLQCRGFEPEVQSGRPARRACEGAFANPSEQNRRPFFDGQFGEMDPTALKAIKFLNNPDRSDGRKSGLDQTAQPQCASQSS
jgi:hypothetical protein